MVIMALSAERLIGIDRKSKKIKQIPGKFGISYYAVLHNITR